MWKVGCIFPQRHCRWSITCLCGDNVVRGVFDGRDTIWNGNVAWRWWWVACGGRCDGLEEQDGWRHTVMEERCWMSVRCSYWKRATAQTVFHRHKSVPFEMTAHLLLGPSQAALSALAAKSSMTPQIACRKREAVSCVLIVCHTMAAFKLLGTKGLNEMSFGGIILSTQQRIFESQKRK